MYEAFGTYTRALISIGVGYDMVSSGAHKIAVPDMQDVRFLRDVGRISSAQHPALVRSIVDFYCSLVVFRSDEDQPEEVLEDIRRHLHEKRDYKYTLGMCMDFVRGVAPTILAAEAVSNLGDADIEQVV